MPSTPAVSAPPSAPIPVTVAAVFQRSWEIYRRWFALLFPLSLVFCLLDGIVSFATRDDPTLTGASLVFGLVTFAVLQCAIVYHVVLVRSGNEPETAGDLVRPVLPVVGTALAATMLSALGVLGGLILVVVPGLILLTWWLVVLPVVVVERTGVVAALTRSRDLVRGHGWTAFRVMLVQMLLVVGVSAIIGALTYSAGDTAFGIGYTATSALLSPLVALMIAVLYFALVDAQAAEAPDEDATTGGTPQEAATDGESLTFGFPGRDADGGPESGSDPR